VRVLIYSFKKNLIKSVYEEREQPIRKKKKIQKINDEFVKKIILDY